MGGVRKDVRNEENNQRAVTGNQAPEVSVCFVGDGAKMGEKNRYLGSDPDAERERGAGVKWRGEGVEVYRVSEW